MGYTLVTRGNGQFSLRSGRHGERQSRRSRQRHGYALGICALLYALCKRQNAHMIGLHIILVRRGRHRVQHCAALGIHQSREVQLSRRIGTGRSQRDRSQRVFHRQGKVVRRDFAVGNGELHLTQVDAHIPRSGSGICLRNGKAAAAHALAAGTRAPEGVGPRFKRHGINGVVSFNSGSSGDGGLFRKSISASGVKAGSGIERGSPCRSWYINFHSIGSIRHGDNTGVSDGLSAAVGSCRSNNGLACADCSDHAGISVYPGHILLRAGVGHGNSGSGRCGNGREHRCAAHIEFCGFGSYSNTLNGDVAAGDGDRARPNAAVRQRDAQFGRSCLHAGNGNFIKDYLREKHPRHFFCRNRSSKNAFVGRCHLNLCFLELGQCALVSVFVCLACKNS